VAGVVVGELYGIHSTAKCFSPIEPLRDIRGVLNCGVLGGKRERSDDENGVVGAIFK
jgi:hypothetical protein